MSYPKQIKVRRKIDALTGIKSSLDKIRSVISFVYLLFVANGRKSLVKYSVSKDSKISIDPKLLESIENLIGHKGLATIINNNPLITNQYEPLYVGVTLLMKLGYLKMEGKQNTAERTGGVRFPKQLYFANNTLVLDLILKGIPEDIRFASLYEWLRNKKATSSDFEDRVCMFLSTCTVFTQFKLRDDLSNELFFQTEGIYSALREGNNDVVYNDSHELVGPTRIYNNVLREGLEPWVKIEKSVLSFSEKENPNAESMGDIISTTLDIHNVNNDALVTDDDIEDNDINDNDETASEDYPLQQIFYGAPGTGKSHKIKEDANVKKADEKNLVFRTTFHPDSDYSTFVGAYKPTMDDMNAKVVPVVLGESGTVFNKNEGTYTEKRIVYQFVPQAFLQAYIAAWNNQEENVYLVIEEINRGNCAQIFGDLFQLLDRDDDGFSEYPIKADRDLARYLIDGKDEKGDDVLTNKDGIQDGKLKLPNNLYIWATMNTSDQSLFPIDSAFKRRWDWVYMPIGYRNNNWTIEIGDRKYNWVGFQHKINESIYAVDNSEDKQLGDYFVNADRTGNKISADIFLNKILFYIWNDVCKDDPDQIFRWIDDKQEKSIKFSDFFGADRDKKLQGFMAFHEIPAIGDAANTNNSEATQDSEGAETNETPVEDGNEVNS